MNIKCIALDLDRTTLNASGRLSDGNYNALCHAIENGVHIVIASGRSFDTLPKDVLAVPGIEYAITSNGAAIYHIPTSTCLHEYKMTPASVECIIQIAKQHETALKFLLMAKLMPESLCERSCFLWYNSTSNSLHPIYKNSY